MVHCKEFSPALHSLENALWSRIHCIRNKLHSANTIAPQLNKVSTIVFFFSNLKYITYLNPEKNNTPHNYLWYGTAPYHELQ